MYCEMAGINRNRHQNRSTIAVVHGSSIRRSMSESDVPGVAQLIKSAVKSVTDTNQKVCGLFAVK